METVSDTAAVEPTRTALVRSVLAGLPRIGMSGTAAGVAAVLRRDVIRAGLDPLEVGEWIAAVGGYQGHTYLRGSRMTMARRECRTPLQPELFYAIPVAASTRRPRPRPDAFSPDVAGERVRAPLHVAPAAS